jgi:hypothetical protein
MKGLLLLCLLSGGATGLLRGQSTFDTIGLTALRAQDPTLTGSGVIIMQVESAPAPLQFEVNPNAPGQPGKLFAFRSTFGLSGTFPNHVGSESGHSDTVAEDLYGASTGVAPGLRLVANYETNYFYSNLILLREPTRAVVFNQSFEFGPHNASQDQAYDNYISQFHTVVLSGIGNGGAILSPADCYNGIGVAAYGGSSSTGPTADGRCKPDITAPGPVTSFSTPLVSGAAAILIQAGRRLGVDSAAAVDSRTIKALLLTGAVKPSGWTQSTTSPLDPNFGAGLLNIDNSYNELIAGRHPPSALALSRIGHPPLTTGPSIAADRGWDSRAITSTSTEAAVNHYRITTTDTGALIATLVWNRPFASPRINQLSIFVYDSTGTLLASSQSTVDNVQHIYLPSLSAGTYDIEVVKHLGPPGASGVVTPRDAYALAWDFGR